MKRNLLYLVLCANLLAGMTSCYDDKSTEATHLIPEIVIDTTGIQPTHSLKRYERLQISPSVSKADTDPSEFSYRWMLSMNPVASTGTKDAYICISEEKDLDAQITVEDNETPYRLWYQVTDNTTGLRKDIVWNVQVLAPYGEGLLVVESHDNGQTSDLALIENELISKGYVGETQIRHNIFSEANEGAKINGEVFQINAFKRYNKTKFYNIFSKSGEDIYLFMDKKYQVLYRNLEAFVDFASDVVKPTSFHVNSGQLAYFVNDNKLHWAWLANDLWEGKWGAPIPNKGATVEVDKTLAIGYSNAPYYSSFYDPTAGCIKQLYNTLARWDLSNIAIPQAKEGWTFDPANCPNHETVYGGLAPSNKTYLMLRNKGTGQYIVFVLGNMGGSDSYYEIPENAAMNEAIAYASNENGNVIYFATKHDIYAIVLNAVPVQVNKVHSFTDEITHFSFFRQARATSSTSSANLDASGRALIAATWDGSKGTVNAIPIANYSVGQLYPAGIVKFGGFGKIMAVTHQYP